MVFKPMTPELFKKYVELVGWRLEKGGIDWNLYSDEGRFVCCVQMSHSRGNKREVTAFSVKKVEQEFKRRRLAWPPRKKSKKS